MADCRKYKEMISAYADGELSPYDESALKRHLDECASCRSLLSLYESIAGTAAEILVEPPESFTESVMSKIKALHENDVSNKTAVKKTHKSLRPVVISFVAAAACLALAFIVSPQLFGIISMSNSAATMPMASAAPTALYSTAVEDAALDNESDAVAKSAESGDTGSVVEDGTGAAPEGQMGITAVTEMPQPAASSAPNLTASLRDDKPKLSEYYAIIYVEGQLPDVLKDDVLINNSDGTFSIEISVDTADQLIADGLKADKGAPDVTKALVMYTPPQ